MQITPSQILQGSCVPPLISKSGYKKLSKLMIYFNEYKKRYSYICIDYLFTNIRNSWKFDIGNIWKFYLHLKISKWDYFILICRDCWGKCQGSQFKIQMISVKIIARRGWGNLWNLEVTSAFAKVDRPEFRKLRS